VQASLGLAPSAPQDDVAMADDATAAEPAAPLPPALVEKITETYAALSEPRKKRKGAAPPGYATTPEHVRAFAPAHAIPSLHAAEPAGVTCLALSALNPGQFLTGGNDKIVQLYDRATDKVLASLTGHTKRVNRVALRERAGEATLLCSAGADKLARIWSVDAASGEYVPRTTIRVHKGEITGLAVHPTGALLSLGSADRTYSLHDLTTLQTLYRSPEDDAPLLAHAGHPDGTLLAFGTPGGAVKVYDTRTTALGGVLRRDGAAPFDVRALCFLENGFQLLANDGASGALAVWDLRKSKVAAAIDLGEGFVVRDAVGDPSAQIVAVAGSGGVRAFAHKSYTELVRFEEAGECAALAWGAESRELWGVSGRDVRIWAGAAVAAVAAAAEA
jgi:pre-mRNA-processing factor 19